MFFNLHAQPTAPEPGNKELTALFDSYYEEFLKMNPVNATFNGDNRYNDLFYIDFTDCFRVAYPIFYNRYLTALKKFNRSALMIMIRSIMMY